VLYSDYRDRERRLAMTLTAEAVLHNGPTAAQAGWEAGVADAEAGSTPLFTYPADLALYARYDYVSAYVDGYESAKGI
jgi:hypothetical protein